MSHALSFLQNSVTLEACMTTEPRSIGDDQTLLAAHRVMNEHQIRHLPVFHGERLVGMLSEKDLAELETLRDIDPAKSRVGEAMNPHVLTVDISTPLAEVAGLMAEKRCGSCVVTQNSRVVGIFTTVDACRALSQLLRNEAPIGHQRDLAHS